jgi:hypothetical protein
VVPGDGEEEEDVGTAAAWPHAVAPVGTTSANCCGGERCAYCYGGAEVPKGGDGEKEGRRRGCCVAARGGVRGSAQRVFVRPRRRVEGMRRPRGCHVCVRGDARGSAKRVCGGALRRVAREQLIGLLRGDICRFRKDQVTRHDSVTRRSTFDNWRLAAEQGSKITRPVTTGVASYWVLRGKRRRRQQLG